MNLDNLKSTWKHYKVTNGVPPVSNLEALILIAESENRKTSIQRILINLVLFLMLTIFIQGG